MGTGRTAEFRKDAVRIALTSGLSRRQVADDLGVGLSTLNKWVSAHRDTIEGRGADVEDFRRFPDRAGAGFGNDILERRSPRTGNFHSNGRLAGETCF
ncbi:MAG: transposase [Tabrizicola sp.]|uniref:transposase n=1 Tax=Tabrizicola sp. TaxID=2005166 RepID=UPI002736552C|nr:transposase [Tabrizicola sp.]MDP3263922.1 transposase [Tabrizicola sp.]MDP3647287.1 transposase [Paracoccaceae bacterium]MDZ4069813.1 transposase [Tabrizicola sp.]